MHVYVYICRSCILHESCLISERTYGICHFGIGLPHPCVNVVWDGACGITCIEAALTLFASSPPAWRLWLSSGLRHFLEWSFAFRPRKILEMYSVNSPGDPLSILVNRHFTHAHLGGICSRFFNVLYVYNVFTCTCVLWIYIIQ